MIRFLRTVALIIGLAILIFLAFTVFLASLYWPIQLTRALGWTNGTADQEFWWVAGIICLWISTGLYWISK